MLLTSKPQVDLYAQGGDTVVTNPAGTVGVKVVDGSPKCLAQLERDLRLLP